MEIYYLFSSLSFLQFYIPLVIEFKKKKYKNIFIIRKNTKKYADPKKKDNNKILKKYVKKYEIITKNDNEINFKKLNNIIFMVDGDIYGPNRERTRKESLLSKLNSNCLKVSLQEHLNFKWNYEAYIDKVDISVFPSKYYATEYNKLSPKNLYLGNTKYDNMLSESEIYKKFNLNSNNKHVLLFFPKKKFRKTLPIKRNELEKIYEYLKKMRYTIIVKARPKELEQHGSNDIRVDGKLKGDKLVVSEIYPNESVELLKICKFCVLFSSSAVEETIMTGTPTIDLVSDNDKATIGGKVQRLKFLYNPQCIKKCTNWQNLTYKNFKRECSDLGNKNDPIFKELQQKYLFSGNISEKLVEHCLKLKK
jgi:hypothetical protein